MPSGTASITLYGCPSIVFEYCQGHWPKRFKLVYRIFSEQSHREIVELNIQKDHIHLTIMVPPEVSISELMERLKGRSAIRILKQHPELRKKRYWGNHFGAPGYCVDTVGLDADTIENILRRPGVPDYETEPLITDISTDGWKSYQAVAKESGLVHHRAVLKDPTDSMKLLPWTHRLIADANAVIHGPQHMVYPKNIFNSTYRRSAAALIVASAAARPSIVF